MRLVIRKLLDLEPDFVFAPERHAVGLLPGALADGVLLGDLVVERRERIDGDDACNPLVLDTTHVRDGLVDVAGALRDSVAARSAKKRAHAGDLVISRLRPYLRQIGLVHPAAIQIAGGRPWALSTEFYVLAPAKDRFSLAFLLPFLLSPLAQETLAAAQEGGHHPRVPRASLLAVRVPRALVQRRTRSSAEVDRALADLYCASSRVRDMLSPAASPPCSFPKRSRMGVGR